MRRALAIALNTFREAIRDRVLAGIIGFAVLYILVVIFLGALSLGDLMMIRSFGLAGVYVFGLLATIFLSSSILYKEIERRTLYFVLAKPVTRGEVVVGKFLGMFAAVALSVGIMAAIYLAVVAYEGGGMDLWGLLAIAFELVELGVFIALLICLSAVASPMTSTVCAVLALFTGHLLGTALAEAKTMSDTAYLVIQALYTILPNLEKFNIRDLVVHQVALTPAVVVATVAYGGVYIAALLYVGWLLFRRREL